LALTVCLASDNLNSSAGQSHPPCPLTSQQVQILLRQALIPFFDNDMFQDLRYDTNDKIHLLPFVVGPNGNAGQVAAMFVPTYLAENVRAMKSLSAVANQKYYNSVMTWHSVLARPSDYPQLGNYLTQNQQPIFRIDPSEVLINLIDASAQQNQAVVYVDFTRIEIAALLERWNQWIQGLQAVLSPLVTLTGQKGIRALNCNIMTNSIQTRQDPTPPPPPPVTGIKKAGVEKTFSVGCSAMALRRIGATPAPGSTYFMDVVENYVSSGQAINPACWPILSKWILPVDFSNDQVEESSSQGTLAFTVEPNKIPRSSSGGIGQPSNLTSSRPDSYSRHLQAAEVDVKAFVTMQPNEIIASLVKIGEDGRGGFLTSTIANLVGSFSPELSGIINTVGQLTGF